MLLVIVPVIDNCRYRTSWWLQRLTPCVLNLPRFLFFSNALALPLFQYTLCWLSRRYCGTEYIATIYRPWCITQRPVNDFYKPRGRDHWFIRKGSPTTIREQQSGGVSSTFVARGSCDMRQCARGPDQNYLSQKFTNIRGHHCRASGG